MTFNLSIIYPTHLFIWNFINNILNTISQELPLKDFNGTLLPHAGMHIDPNNVPLHLPPPMLNAPQINHQQMHANQAEHQQMQPPNQLGHMPPDINNQWDHGMHRPPPHPGNHAQNNLNNWPPVMDQPHFMPRPNNMNIRPHRPPPAFRGFC